MEYVSWTDPREGAWTMEAPRGWQVSGGLFRFSPLDARSAYELASPDGSVRITGGDQNIGTFVPPAATFYFYREGQQYSPDGLTVFTVAEYRNGPDFVRGYVQQKFGPVYSNLCVLQSRERPDMASAWSTGFMPWMQQGVSAGEVSFTARTGGATVFGYYLAVTRYDGMMGGSGIWTVPMLGGYVAVEEKAGEAAAVMQHVIGSFSLNPQWLGMQSGIAVQSAEINRKANQEISQMIQGAYEYRQNVMDDVSRKWSNVILGKTDVRDPQTGETWKITSGHNYYWRRGDTIVGTDTYDRPDINFEPLQEF